MILLRLYNKVVSGPIGAAGEFLYFYDFISPCLDVIVLCLN